MLSVNHIHNKPLYKYKLPFPFCLFGSFWYVKYPWQVSSVLLGDFMKGLAYWQHHVNSNNATHPGTSCFLPKSVFKTTPEIKVKFSLFKIGLEYWLLQPQQVNPFVTLCNKRNNPEFMHPLYKLYLLSGSKHSSMDGYETTLTFSFCESRGSHMGNQEIAL